MSEVLAFLAGLIATMGVVFVALLYLKNPLQVMLTDLCGTADRARFWTAFSNVTLFLVPFVLALNGRPDPGAGESTAFVISTQIEYAIAGFVLSVVALGFILSRYISRPIETHAVKGVDVL